jgi:integrase/recombinase XerD
MKNPPDRDDRFVDRYLSQLQLRSRAGGGWYRSVLVSFQRLAQQRGWVVDRPLVEDWLRERSRHWPMPTLLHRARIVDRFLDFLAQEDLIAANPLAHLRTEHRLRGTAAVARALLSDDPQVALEVASRLPPYASFLGEFLRNHVQLMQALGRKYRTQENRFLRFDRFLQTRPDLAGAAPARLLEQWAASCPTVSHAWQCQQLRNDLAKAWKRVNPQEVLPRGDPLLWRRIERRQPYVFTPAEVERLLDTAMRTPSPRAPLRPLSLYTMIALAYCCGLRLGEIVRLDLGDVNLQAGEISIRNTKFFKSRILPVAPTVLDALRRYIEARRAAGASQDPSSALFWHTQHRGRYSNTMAGKLLTGVLRRAGMKPQAGRVGPRTHDLRHAFAVNRLLAWYRSGIDVTPRLPYLTTYMGHKKLHSTLVYLTATPELMQQASERFRGYAAHVLHATEGAQP